MSQIWPNEAPRLKKRLPETAKPSKATSTTLKPEIRCNIKLNDRLNGIFLSLRYSVVWSRWPFLYSFSALFPFLTHIVHMRCLMDGKRVAEIQLVKGVTFRSVWHWKRRDGRCLVDLCTLVTGKRTFGGSVFQSIWIGSSQTGLSSFVKDEQMDSGNNGRFLILLCVDLIKIV